MRVPAYSPMPKRAIERVDPRRDAVLRIAADAREELERLAARETRIEGRAGRVEPELAANGFGLPRQVVAHHARRARGRRQDRRQHPERRRLSRTVGAEQPEDLAGSAGEVDAVDGPDLAAALVVERLGQCRHFDGQHGHRAQPLPDERLAADRARSVANVPAVGADHDVFGFDDGRRQRATSTAIAASETAAVDRDVRQVEDAHQRLPGDERDVDDRHRREPERQLGAPRAKEHRRDEHRQIEGLDHRLTFAEGPRERREHHHAGGDESRQQHRAGSQHGHALRAAP